MNRINLLPKSYIDKRMLKALIVKLLALWAFIFLGCFLLFVGSDLLIHYQISTIEKCNSLINSSQFENSSKTAKQLREIINNTSKLTKIITNIPLADSVDIDSILMFEHMLPEKGICIKTLESNSKEITLKGESLSKELFSDFMHNIANEETFTEVNFREFIKRGDIISFEIKISLASNQEETKIE